MQKLFSIVLVVTSIIYLIACDNSTTPKLKSESGFDVVVEDVHASEAWLEIKVETTNISRDITLNFDSQLDSIMTLSIIDDTLIHLQGLNPLSTYSISCNQAETNDFQASQKEVNFTTMDTTSHEFEWSYWEFGDYASSLLSDITIIDENNIWAVGDVNLYDSIGSTDPKPTNVFHWDGEFWTSFKAPVKFRGYDTFIPFYGISSDADGGVWVAAGSPIKKESQQWELNDLRDYFGPDVFYNIVHVVTPEQVYFGGKNGNLVSLTGVYWKQLNPGTDLHFYDIWGDYNDELGEYEVLAVAGEVLVSNDNKFYSITNTEALWQNFNINKNITGIWFISDRSYFAVGNGLFKKHKKNDISWENIVENVTTYRMYDVIGQDVNDVFICGAFGELLHYNGISWYSYMDKELESFYGRYHKMDYKNGIIAIIGYDGSVGKIIIGRKM